MGILILTVISGILLMCNVISVVTFMVIVSSSVTLSILNATLYLKFGWFKFFYHDFLHWHAPNTQPQWSDGYNTHATCKHCGNDIMQDSQGNWFC